MGVLFIAYLVLVLGVAPLLSWRAAASGMIRLTPRMMVYRSGITTAWLLALTGAAVLWWEQTLAPGDVGLQLLPPVALLGWSAAALLALLICMGLFSLLRHLTGRDESPDLLHLLPQSRQERWLFSALALTAGLTEEFVFRGIAQAGLLRLPGLDEAQAPWLAAAVVALAFGFGHGYQDGLGMLRAGLMGFVLAVPLILTGSLLPGMVAHAALDMTALLRARPAPNPGQAAEAAP